MFQPRPSWTRRRRWSLAVLLLSDVPPRVRTPKTRDLGQKIDPFSLEIYEIHRFSVDLFMDDLWKSMDSIESALQIYGNSWFPMKFHWKSIQTINSHSIFPLMIYGNPWISLNSHCKPNGIHDSHWTSTGNLWNSWVFMARIRWESLETHGFHWIFNGNPW